MKPIQITTKIMQCKLMIPEAIYYITWQFHQIPSVTFWVILFTCKYQQKQHSWLVIITLYWGLSYWITWYVSLFHELGQEVVISWHQNLALAINNIWFRFKYLEIIVDRIREAVLCVLTCWLCVSVRDLPARGSWSIFVFVSCFLSPVCPYTHTYTHSVLTEAKRETNGHWNAESSRPEPPPAPIELQSMWPHQ